MLRTALLPIVLSLLLAPAALAVPKGGTVLVDRPSGSGALPFDGSNDAISGTRALTADGCTVVYTSTSDALLATDDDGAENVYAQDRCTPRTPPVQVNVSAAGKPAQGGTYARDATVSADGRYVAFVSNARSLHPGANGAEHYVFVKDLQTGAVEIASRGTGESGATVAYPENPVISGDGRSVVFTANGAVDAVGDQDGVDGADNAYIRSLVFDLTRMVSLTAGGVRGSGVSPYGHTLGVDHTGGNVVFISSSRLTPEDTDDENDVYRRRGIGTLGQTTELVSYTVGNTTGATSATEAAISGDGSRIAYTNGRVWVSECTPCKPAVRIDQARNGGTNSGQGHMRPFFPQTGASAPSAVFWTTDDPLDPADTNGGDDIYGAALAGGADPVRSLTGGVSDGPVGFASANDAMNLVVFTARPVAKLPGADGVHPQVFERAGGTVRNIVQAAGLPARASAAGHGRIDARHAVSDDGRLVVFVSQALALGSPLKEGYRLETVLARDTRTGTTIPISVAPDGRPANWYSRDPSVDAAGRRVAFASAATNLGPAVTGQNEHVYVRDLRTGAIRLLDRAADGKPSLDGARKPQISGDGTTVVFESSSPDLPGAGAGVQHVYRADLATGRIVLVDRSGAGVAGNKRAAAVDVSSDGRRVAFESEATNLGPADAYREVYVRDVAAGTTTWASVPEGTPAVRPKSGSPSLSGDGNRVAFTVEGAGFGRGAVDDDQRVYVRDVAARRTTPASPTGPEAAGDEAPSLSRDGMKVAFVRYSSQAPRGFVRDFATGSLARGDKRNGSAAPGRFGAYGVSLSSNGACMAFYSASDDLVSPSPSPDFTHVYLHALSRDCPARAAGPARPGPDTRAPTISGARVTNKRFAPARGRTARTARVKRGTAFVFRLSEKARTRIAIARKRGRRYVRAVRLMRANTRQGSNRVAFTGRVGRRALARGQYRATIVATDAAGNRSKPAFVRFRVVR